MKAIFTVLALSWCWCVGAQRDLNSHIDNLYFPLREHLSSACGKQVGGKIRVFKGQDWSENRKGEAKAALYLSKENAGLYLPTIKMKAATRFTISLWVMSAKPQRLSNFFGDAIDFCVKEGGPSCVFPKIEFSRSGWGAFPVQEWFMMTIVYKDGQTEVYKNDDIQPTLTTEYLHFDELNRSFNVGFGFLESDGSCFVGAIGDVRMFNVALTEAQRLSFYKSDMQYLDNQYVENKNASAPKTTARGAERNAPQIHLHTKTRDLGIAPRQDGQNIEIAGELLDQSPIKSLKINGEEVEFEAVDGFKSTFSQKINLAGGAHKVTVEATDIHGNKASETVNIEVAAPKNIGSASPNRKKFNAPTQLKLHSAGYYALIIGVSEYEEEHMVLENPVRDAGRVRDVLMANYGYDDENIFFLEDPDKEEVMEAFAELKSQLTDDDNLLIFYAGHGHWDKTTHKSYWLPADADHKQKTNWISSVDIADQLVEMQAQHVLIVSDACFSGGFLKTREISSEDDSVYETLYNKKSRRIITSGDIETVPDESVFIRYFIQSLENNEKKYLSCEDLFADFKKAVIANSPGNQVPQSGVLHQSGDEGGNFIFYKK